MADRSPIQVADVRRAAKDVAMKDSVDGMSVLLAALDTGGASHPYVILARVANQSLMTGGFTNRETLFIVSMIVLNQKEASNV
jgi:hypothetical protein